MTKKEKWRSFSELQQRTRKDRYKREPVRVDEWDSTVWVRQMSGAEFQKINEMASGDDLQVSQMAEILAFAVEDEHGDSPQPKWLIDEPFSVLKRLTNEVLRVNGLDEESRLATEKNS